MTYIDIYCEDTVDARIVKALKKKVNIASQIMGEQLKRLDLTVTFTYKISWINLPVFVCIVFYHLSL